LSRIRCKKTKVRRRTFVLLAAIKEIAERPKLAELRDRLHTRERATLPVDTARLAREERNEN
jgi:hypothetical protein